MNETEKSENFSNDDYIDLPVEKISKNEFSVNNVSKLSENNNITSSIISTLKMYNDKDQDNLSTTSKRNNYIYIKIMGDNSSLKIDFSLLEKGYPDILSHINYDTKTLILNEKWIDYKTIKDYFTYVKLSYCKKMNESLSDLSFNFKKLGLLVNYFENEKILDDIIKFNLEPNINRDTCISLINDSFKYCSENLNSNIKSKWFTLFLKLRDYIIENFLFYLEEEQIYKFQKLDKKLLNELVETFLFDIYTKGIEITSQNASELIILINYLYDNSNTINNNINYETIFLFLKDSNLKNTIIPQNYKFPAKPTYSINIMKDISFNYQEKLIQFYKQECIFISIYNKSDDTFSISLKLNPINNIEAFSFISYAHLIEDNESNNNLQVTYNTINSNSIVTLYTINNFRSYITYMKGINDIGNLILEINLKFCVIESFIICYLKSCFQSIINEQSIFNLPYNILNILIANINNNQQYKDEDILKVIDNWLSYDLNYKFKINNIQEVFEQINWKNIPLEKIFEFIIKFPLVLEKLKQTENDIISSIFTKSNEKLIEMNKDVLFNNKIISDDDKKSFNKRKNSQYSFEGDNEKSKVIINENEGEYKETKSKENTNEFNKNKYNKENLITNENQINLLSYFFINLVECSKKLNYHKYENNFKNKIKTNNSNNNLSNNNINKCESLITNYNINKSLSNQELLHKSNENFENPLIIKDDEKIEDNDSKINEIKSDERMPTLDIDLDNNCLETKEKEFIVNKPIKEEEIEDMKEDDNKEIKKEINEEIKDNSKINSFRSNNNKINEKNNLNYSNSSNQSYNSNSNNIISTNSSNKNNKSNFIYEGVKNLSPSVKLYSIVLKGKNNKKRFIYDANKSMNEQSFNREKENN